MRSRFFGSLVTLVTGAGFVLAQSAVSPSSPSKVHQVAATQSLDVFGGVDEPKKDDKEPLNKDEPKKDDKDESKKDEPKKANKPSY